jgi:pimeloyl-ACP methyl ester carboxylesterase
MRPKGNIAVSSDGTNIHFDVKGKGDVALVFVHGWCCDRTYWDSQVNYFASNYTVVTLDVAGHGDSGIGRKKWTVPAFGRDIVAVMNHLELQAGVLIGHSAGGQWIVEAARHRPKCIIGLVGVDTWHNVEQTFAPIQIAEMLEPFRNNFPEAARAHARKMFLPTSDADLIKRVVDAMSEAPSKIAIDSREEALRTYCKLPNALSCVKAPKYAINSKDFRRTYTSVARRHGIKVVLTSGAGHFVMLEKPAEFALLLGEILDTLLATNARKDSDRD